MLWTMLMRWYILKNMKNQQKGNVARQKKAAQIWEPRRAQIMALYVNGDMSQAEMAAMFEVSQQGFQRAISRMGIPSKGRGRAGELNGRFIDGTQSTLYRQMVVKDRCNRCGATDQLVIHHKDHNHTNNVMGNLEVMCSPCHTSHHKAEWWRSQKDGRS